MQTLCHREMRRVYAKLGAALLAADLRESTIGKFRFRLI
jgi:hypothetical protein